MWIETELKSQCKRGLSDPMHQLTIYLLLTYRLDVKGDIKVSDFGLSEDMYTAGYFRQDKDDRVKLPFKWMALESLMDGIYDEKTDVVCNISDR